jgi:hypothetical protein
MHGQRARLAPQPQAMTFQAPRRGGDAERDAPLTWRLGTAAKLRKKLGDSGIAPRLQSSPLSPERSKLIQTHCSFRWLAGGLSQGLKSCLAALQQSAANPQVVNCSCCLVNVFLLRLFFFPFFRINQWPRVSERVSWKWKNSARAGVGRVIILSMDRRSHGIWDDAAIDGYFLNVVVILAMGVVMAMVMVMMIMMKMMMMMMMMMLMAMMMTLLLCYFAALLLCHLAALLLC